ncbi:MAG: DUF2284 domain-containing protein [Treponema sp.]|jgi:predicted metal-binding protein|nr:DUF2284 domain-containing protein [Treponema sp.]
MMKHIKDLALRCGFSQAGELNVDTITVREEVRAACTQNKCKAYSANWSCPPACGTLDACEVRIRAYKKGILLQTTGLLEDSFDYETMEKTGKNHKENLTKFAKEIRNLYPSCLVIGAGACMRCGTCTYPDAPCRFPTDMISSMEALGMLVSDVCKDNNLPYYYGPNTLTYTGCVLLE